jgi:cobalamin biosynthesis protein CbiG
VSGSFVVGIGTSGRGTDMEIATLVAAALTGAGLDRADVRCVATVDARADDPRLTALGWPVVGFGAALLDAVTVAAPSARVRAAVGTASVAEAAALLAAGPGAALLVGPQRSEHVTVAVARGTGASGVAAAP